MFARIAIVVVAVLVVAGQSWGAKPLSESFPTQHFNIRYTKGDYLAAERVSRAAEEALEKISARLGYQGQHKRIEVRIYPNHREFVKATGTDRGTFIMGRAHSGIEMIELDSQELFAKLETVTAHEVAHIVVFRLVGNYADMPLWAHEGIAKFESDDWDDTDTHLMAEAVSFNKLLWLSEISHEFPKDREALAYAESASFIQYLTETYGRTQLPLLLEQTRKTGSLQQALKVTTGTELKDLEAAWFAYLEKHYAPYLWVRMISTGAMGLLPILALMAFLAARRRKRRRLEEYELAEWEEANLRDWGNHWPGGGLQ